MATLTPDLQHNLLRDLTAARAAKSMRDQWARPQRGDKRNIALRRVARLSVFIVFMLSVAVGLLHGTTAAAGRATQVSVAGSIWLDVNMNGQRDANDTIYTDCVVFLEEVVPEDSDVIGTAVAFGDQDGQFVFFDVKAGRYLLWAEMGDHTSAAIDITITEDVTQTTPVELLMPPYTNFLPLLVRS